MAAVKGSVISSGMATNSDNGGGLQWACMRAAWRDSAPEWPQPRPAGSPHPQASEAMREVPAREQLQFEEGERVKPLVEEKHHEQQSSATQHHADEMRSSASRGGHLASGRRLASHGGEPGEEARPVESAEPFKLRGSSGRPQRTARQLTIPYAARSAEHHLPASILGPQCGERCSERGAERRRHCIACEPIELDLGWQITKGHNDEHGRQAAARDTLRTRSAYGRSDSVRAGRVRRDTSWPARRRS